MYSKKMKSSRKNSNVLTESCISAYNRILDDAIKSRGSVCSMKKDRNDTNSSLKKQPSVTYISSKSPNRPSRKKSFDKNSMEYFKESSKNKLKILKKNIYGLLKKLTAESVDNDSIDNGDILGSRQIPGGDFGEVKLRAKAIFFECNQTLQGLADQYISDYSACNGDLATRNLPKMRNEEDVSKMLRQLLKRIKLSERCYFCNNGEGGEVKSYKENTLGDKIRTMGEKKPSDMTIPKYSRTVNPHNIQNSFNLDSDDIPINHSSYDKKSSVIISLQNSARIDSAGVTTPLKTETKPRRYDTNRFERVENTLFQIIKKLEGIEQRTIEKEDRFMIQSPNFQMFQGGINKKRETIRKPNSFKNEFRAHDLSSFDDETIEEAIGMCFKATKVNGFTQTSGRTFVKTPRESPNKGFMVSKATAISSNRFKSPIKRRKIQSKEANSIAKSGSKYSAKGSRLESGRSPSPRFPNNTPTKTFEEDIMERQFFHKKPLIKPAVITSSEDVSKQVSSNDTDFLKSNKIVLSFNDLSKHQIPEERGTKSRRKRLNDNFRESRVKELIKLATVLKGVKIITKNKLGQWDVEEILQDQIEQTQVAIEAFLRNYDFLTNIDKKILVSIQSFLKNMDKASELLEQSSLFFGKAKNNFIFGIYRLIDKAIFSILDCIDKLKIQFLDILPESETERILEYFNFEGKQFETDEEAKRIIINSMSEENQEYQLTEELITNRVNSSTLGKDRWEILTQSGGLSRNQSPLDKISVAPIQIGSFNNTRRMRKSRMGRKQVRTSNSKQRKEQGYKGVINTSRKNSFNNINITGIDFESGCKKDISETTQRGQNKASPGNFIFNSKHGKNIKVTATTSKPNPGSTFKVTSHDTQESCFYSKEIKEEAGSKKNFIKLDVGEGKITTILSIDDQLLAISFSSGDLVFFDVEKQEPICCIREHSVSISTMEMAWIKMKNQLTNRYELKRLLMTGGSEPENLVIAWDIENFKPLKRLSGHSHLISSIRDLGDHATLATASFDSRVAFWDLRDHFKCIQLLEEHDSPVLCLDFNAGDKTLCTGCLDGTISLWNLHFDHGIYQGCLLKRKLRVEGHVLDISRTLSFPDAVITLESDNKIRLYSLKSANMVKCFNQKEPGEVQSRKFMDFVVVERKSEGPILFAIDENCSVKKFDDWKREEELVLSDDRLREESTGMINNFEFVRQIFSFRPRSQVLIQGKELIVVSVKGMNNLVLQSLDVY